MKSKQITVNNVDITAHSDGSITKPFYSRTKRTFGSNSLGYKRVRVGDKNYQVHSLVAQAFLSDFNDFPEVDHIDGSTSNNDLSNLRMKTSSGNKWAHKTKSKGCSSQYRGVGWKKANKKWQASCMVNYKLKHLGLFDSERDAAIARDAYAFSQGFELEGLNFPENYA